MKVVNLANPQTWNMYAYTTDNPTTLNDPSGLQSDLVKAGCGTGPGKSFCQGAHHEENAKAGSAERVARTTDFAVRGFYRERGASADDELNAHSGIGGYSGAIEEARLPERVAQSLDL